MGIRSLRADSKCCNEDHPWNSQHRLACKVVDDVRFHISFNQKNPLSNRPDHMAPVLTHGSVQLVPTGKGQELTALFHFYDQGEFENLVSSQSRFPESESPYATQPLSIAHPCPDKIQGRQTA